MNINLVDRAKGALLGLACGDAVGTALEFQKKKSPNTITDMIGGGPFNLKKGQWTDDTSMALCLGYSLVEKGGSNPKDQMDRYCRWKNEGYLSSTGECFDIGTTVRQALVRYESTGNPISGWTNPMAAGNGCIMRLAPVVLYYFPDLQKVLHFAAESSRTTHGCLECIESTQLLAAQIYTSLNGIDKKEIIFQKGVSFSAPKVAAIARGDFLSKKQWQLNGSGYVIETMESALWCFHNTTNFKEAVLLAANLSDDADTVAAICGQIAGAYYGFEDIPKEWLRNLYMAKEIEALAVKLINKNETSKKGL
jgi:ADP-ribosyl-[dinitrogen reductase] hydrolase